MRNYKRYLAVALAATMVVGSSVAVEAKSYISGSQLATTSSDAQGSVTGTGEMEGQLSEDVFQVVVPTQITGTSSWDGFDFVMDPQMLITKTSAKKYVSASTPLAKGFEEGKTLYFTKRTDEILDDTSDYALITNKSSIDVDIAIKAEMTDHAGIALSATPTFADDSVSMYMAVIGTDGTEAIKEDGGAEVTGTIPKASDGAYTTVYDENDGYKYELVDADDPDAFSTYEFALTGACNSNADWQNVSSTVAPKVQLTWKVEPHVDVEPTAAAPSIPQATYAAPATGNLDITVDLGVGDDLKATGIESVTFTNANNAVKPLTAGTDYTFSGTTLTINRAALDAIANASRTYTVTFNDTAKTTATVTVTK